MDLAQFANTIALYGFSQLKFVAPIIVSIEIGLGVGLLLRLQLRWLALMSFITLIIFTLSFAYGYLWHGVTSCGCFGAFDVLQTPPWISFVRNAILMIMAGWLFFAAPKKRLEQSIQYGHTAIIVAALTILSAIGFSYLYFNQTKYSKPLVTSGQSVRTSALAEFCPVDTTSTYLVFVFSPTCPHCWAATPKIVSYQSSGLVSKIIALCPPSAAQEQQKYLQHFGQPFTIRVVDRDKLHQITDQVPTAILIQRAKVVKILTTHIPTADSLKTTLENTFSIYAKASLK